MLDQCRQLLEDSYRATVLFPLGGQWQILHCDNFVTQSGSALGSESYSHPLWAADTKQAEAMLECTSSQIT